ncbi:MAG: RNA polymerase sigma factor [Bacteroidetes bacterium]|nr:RNA polymerase sigma factor [Bacteroidota bacterium]
MSILVKFPKRKSLSEEQLIGLLVEKNEIAFRHLVHLYENKIYNTVISFLRSEEYADDVTQEVFISIYQSIESFRKESSLSTWIHRIAVTKTLEFLRKQNRKKRWGALYSLWGDDLSPKFEAVSYDHPGVALENKQTSEALFKALDRLPTTQRTAFTLHKIDGHSYDETAQIMNNSISAIESLVHRATSNLRKYLADYYKNL